MNNQPKMITLRTSEEHHNLIKEEAQYWNVPMNTYIIRTVLRAIQARREQNQLVQGATDDVGT